MTLEEIQERLYSSTGITPVRSGVGFGKSAVRDENRARLASYEGYTALDKLAMDAMKRGYNVEDPTKTMTGLLGVLSPNLSFASQDVAAPRIATKVAMDTGIIPKTEETNIPGIIAMLAGSYTDRIKDYLDRFQDLPDIRQAFEAIDDEDKLPPGITIGSPS